MTAVPAARAIPSPRAGTRFRRARLDAGVRLGSVAALWSSLLLVTYWWAAGGGLQDLTGWETGLDSTGRLTGLVASDLLLVQVLLMARLPVLEHAFGQDRLAVLHRLVGFTSFNLMLAHVVLITWGYAAGDLLATPVTAWNLTAGLPGHAARGRRHGVPGDGRGHQRQGRAQAGCATSPGTCCTSTPTSASAWPCRTSCGPGRS